MHLRADIEQSSFTCSEAESGPDSSLGIEVIAGLCPQTPCVTVIAISVLRYCPFLVLYGLRVRSLRFLTGDALLIRPV